MTSMTNQAYIINDFGEGSVTLSDGTFYHFCERTVKIKKINAATDVSALMYKSEPLMIGNLPPPDKNGYWHLLVFFPHDFGISPAVIAVLSPEEATDMQHKIDAVNNEALRDYS
jgi:hypothetical protein